MNRKIKLFLHHKIDEEVSVPQSKKAFFKKCLFLIPSLIATASYYIGLVLVSVVTFPKLIWNLKWPQTFNFKSLLAFLILLVLASAPLALLKLASEGQQLGGRVLGLKDNLIANTNSAQDAIKNKDYQLAQSNFSNVLANLQTAQTELDNSSIALRSLVKLTPDQYNSENLLQAATLLTESGIIGSQILQQIGNLSISPEGFGPTASADFANLVSATEQISSKLTKANELMGELNSSLLPAQYQLALQDSQAFVSDLSKQMQQLNKVMNIANKVLMTDKRFLIILQNNNELRSSGGFIGTIAQGNFSSGSIKKLDIRSVYDLDGQLTEQIKVPSPLTSVNNRLYLRDSNWLADFPDTAEVLSSMYEKEGGETPDLIMAINPELFIELLKLTGPITLPSYKVTLDSNNFIETVQTTTSIEYDKNLNQPKQMLADLYPALLQKLNQLFKDNPITLLSVLQKSLAQKELLIYSKEPSLQQDLEAFHWAGQVEDTDGDYLQIVSNNLSGTKTDRFLHREVKLQTNIDEQGSITNQLTYSIYNPLPNNESLINKSWVRFLVPQNSKLIAGEGFSKGPESFENSSRQVDNSLIANWQSTLKHDSDRNIDTGTESGKTFFGGWIEAAPGQTATVTLTYQLPFKLRGNINHYSLLLQKQPGMMPFAYNHKLEFPERSLIWENLGSKNIQLNKQDSNLSFNQQITQDQLFGLVLDKK
jgi:hypothetical protein